MSPIVSTINSQSGVIQEALPLTLTPRVHPAITSFIKEEAKLRELVGALGSPLNIVFPQHVRGNAEAFYDVFAKHNIQGRVYFAHKANQSDSVVRQMAMENINIDISSVGEIRHALGCGFTGARMEATGPKSIEFLTLAVQHGVTINLDSITELKRVLAIRKVLKINAATPVLIRLSGFEAEHSKFLNKASRFGIPLAQLPEAFELLVAECKSITFLGFSFHLDTVSIPERAVAIENCIQLFEEALALGLEPRVLNIGGGYKINYLASEQEWNRYTSALRESVLGTREQLSWQGNAFGMHAEKGKLRGNFNSYSYWDELSGAAFLDEILSYQFPNLGDRTAGSMLGQNMIELWIEPGRSLVDQTGITVAQVNSIRSSSRGDTLVCLNMKRQDICFLDQEIFVDPVVVYSDSQGLDAASYQPVYFTGNLCLESDLIYRHKTFLPKLPAEGDLVVFVNTAGYFMDFSATNSIMQPIAKKAAVFQNNGGFGWSMDDQYSPMRNALTTEI